MENNEACILCGPTGNIECAGDTVEVARGLHKLVECSVSEGDNVREQLNNKHSVVVHVKCRKEYTRRTESTPKRVRHGLKYSDRNLISKRNVYFAASPSLEISAN